MLSRFLQDHGKIITSAFIDSVTAWFLYDNPFDVRSFQKYPYLNWAMGGALGEPQQETKHIHHTELDL
jgi:hypothetical protein